MEAGGESQRQVDDIHQRTSEKGVLCQESNELEELISNHLNAEKLVQLTRQSDLAELRYLELRVDTRKITLGNLGQIVPSLQQFKINNSNVPSIRDLGTGYNNLQILFIARSELISLEGIGSLRALRELYAAYNVISDISALSMLDNLEILDLEGNSISQLEQIENLALCSELQQLSLDGNPIAGYDPQATGDEKCIVDCVYETFREHVLQILPQILVLDDEFVQRTQPESIIKDRDGKSHEADLSDIVQIPLSLTTPTITDTDTRTKSLMSKPTPIPARFQRSRIFRASIPSESSSHSTDAAALITATTAETQPKALHRISWTQPASLEPPDMLRRPYSSQSGRRGTLVFVPPDTVPAMGLISPSAPSSQSEHVKLKKPVVTSMNVKRPNGDGAHLPLRTIRPVIPPPSSQNHHVSTAMASITTTTLLSPGLLFNTGTGCHPVFSRKRSLRMKQKWNDKSQSRTNATEGGNIELFAKASVDLPDESYYSKSITSTMYMSSMMLKWGVPQCSAVDAVRGGGEKRVSPALLLRPETSLS